MILEEKEKKFEENKLAELVVLIGGGEKYEEKKGDLEGFEKVYLDNKDKAGFHYRRQKYGDKIIREIMKGEGHPCKKRKSKRYYRYSRKNCNAVDYRLYDYFECVMNFIMKKRILFNIAVKYVFEDCRCVKMEERFGACISEILNWQYERLIAFENDCNIRDHKKKERAAILLKKLNSYNGFAKFKKKCLENK